jgi:hypothetical protein
MCAHLAGACLVSCQPEKHTQQGTQGRQSPVGVRMDGDAAGAVDHTCCGSVLKDLPPLLTHPPQGKTTNTGVGETPNCPAVPLDSQYLMDREPKLEAHCLQWVGHFAGRVLCCNRWWAMLRTHQLLQCCGRARELKHVCRPAGRTDTRACNMSSQGCQQSFGQRAEHMLYVCTQVPTLQPTGIN